jgi:glycerol kinase
MTCPRTVDLECLSLLLDFGGQSCHALVMDGRGVCITQAEVPNQTRQSGLRVELDGESVVAGFQQLLASIDDALLAEGRQVRRVAMACQRGSVIAWDRETGKALGPMLSWRDRRISETMQMRPEQAEWIRHRAGLRWSPYAGAPKLRWLLDHLPSVRAAAKQEQLVLGPAGSFLLARLLRGRPCLVDDSLAQRTLLWSCRSMDWDEELLETFGLEDEQLPEVCPSSFEFGRLEAMKGQPPVRIVVGDQNAVPFLTGQPDPDCLYVNLGTGGFVLRPVDRPLDVDCFQLSLLSRQGGGRFALEGSIHGAATALNWLAERSDGVFRAAELDDLCAGVGQPPLFVNTLDGLGSPWWCDGGEPAFEPSCKHCDAGLAAEALAIVESIVFLVRANLEAMNEHVEAPKRIVLSGGLSRSEILRQRLADGLGLPVEVLIEGEGTAIGAWCMLDPAHVLPDRAWQTISPGRDPALERRYAKWLELIEARLTGPRRGGAGS